MVGCRIGGGKGCKGLGEYRLKDDFGGGKARWMTDSADLSYRYEVQD